VVLEALVEDKRVVLADVAAGGAWWRPVGVGAASGRGR
jgi:hypothetical protein